MYIFPYHNIYDIFSEKFYRNTHSIYQSIWKRRMPLQKQQFNWTVERPLNHISYLNNIREPIKSQNLFKCVYKTGFFFQSLTFQWMKARWFSSQFRALDTAEMDLVIIKVKAIFRGMNFYILIFFLLKPLGKVAGI